MIYKKLIYTILTLCCLTITSCFDRQDRVTTETTDSLQVEVPNIKWGINIDNYQVIDSVIGRNELLSTILYRYGVGGATINEVEKESFNTYSVRKLRAGKPYHILIPKTDTLACAEYFIYDIKECEEYWAE
jgi:hypothetical protein